MAAPGFCESLPYARCCLFIILHSVHACTHQHDAPAGDVMKIFIAAGVRHRVRLNPHPSSVMRISNVSDVIKYSTVTCLSGSACCRCSTAFYQCFLDCQLNAKHSSWPKSLGLICPIISLQSLRARSSELWMTAVLCIGLRRQKVFCALEPLYLKLSTAASTSLRMSNTLLSRVILKTSRIFGAISHSRSFPCARLRRIYLISTRSTATKESSHSRN